MTCDLQLMSMEMDDTAISEDIFGDGGRLIDSMEEGIEVGFPSLLLSLRDFYLTVHIIHIPLKYPFLP